MSSDILIARCKAHRRHPVHGCVMCTDAIAFNRCNPGWGPRYTRLNGMMIEYQYYDPSASWDGDDAFITEEEVTW